MNRIVSSPNPISVTRAYAINAKNPIVTKASGQGVGSAQTFGLPGSKENKTTLGAYRMGESEWSTGAIYPGHIFPPIPAPERKYTEVMFSNVGNNTYQPEQDDSALHSLLKRIGEQKFKASESAPFDEYFRIQKLAKDVEDATKMSGVEDKTLGREIIRGLVDLRRKQNEDDYLRRLIDAGMGAEQAQKEIDDARRARALFEAKNVDDRPYQAKMLIHNLSKKRGVISGVNEPLTQSAAISAPAPNHTMASIMGKPEEAFGEQPLDVNRINMTPEFYKRFLRRSALTSENADAQTAMNQLIAEGGYEVKDFRFPAMVSAASREKQIIDARDGAMARLEVLRNRGTKAMIKLPPHELIAPGVIEEIYRVGLGDKRPLQPNPFKRESIDEMNTAQLIVALNIGLYSGGDSAIRAAKTALSSKNIGTQNAIVPNIKEILKEVVKAANNSNVVSIPVGIGANGDIAVAKDIPSIRMETFKVLTDLARLTPESASVELNTATSREFAQSYSEQFAPLLGQPERMLEQMMRQRESEVARFFPPTEQNPPSNIPALVAESEADREARRQRIREATLARVEPPAPVPVAQRTLPPLPKGKTSMTAADWRAWATKAGVDYTTVKDMKDRYGGV